MRLVQILQRSLLSVLGLLVVVGTVQLQVVSQPPVSSSFTPTILTQTQKIEHSVIGVKSIGMTVSDMDRAVNFYSKVLSFKKTSDIEILGKNYEQLQGLFGVRLRVVKMQLGNEVLELTEYLTPKGRPIPIDSRSNDHWFQHIAIVVSDMDMAYQHLQQHKIQYTSTAPQRIPDWNQAAAGIRAFYFKDPDGHNLEIIYFPPGKGNPKWQKTTKHLFLGIDHTAIVVSSTEASLKFYRDLLGLEFAGESLNYGTEQEYLNHVQGARLRISGLQSPNGPGIEFLEYLEPKDGRSLPADAKTNDVLHWQTTLVFRNIEIPIQQLQRNRSSFISSNLVTLPGQVLGFRRGIVIRDPDGHALRLVEE